MNQQTDKAGKPYKPMLKLEYDVPTVIKLNFDAAFELNKVSAKTNRPYTSYMYDITHENVEKKLFCFKNLHSMLKNFGRESILEVIQYKQNGKDQFTVRVLKALTPGAKAAFNQGNTYQQTRMVKYQISIRIAVSRK